MAFSGSCHCGAVQFTCNEETPGEALACNCSWCSRQGSLLHFTTGENFRLERGGDALREYRFNKRVIAHKFCCQCGVSMFSEVDGAEGPVKMAINLRCTDVPLEGLAIRTHDGASA
jgi:hypothetical protein